MKERIKSFIKSPFVKISAVATAIVFLTAVLGSGINYIKNTEREAIDKEGYALFSKDLSEEYYNEMKSRFVNQKGESYEDYRMLEGISISFYGDGGIIDESTGGYTIPALTGLNFLERYVYIMGNNGETPDTIAARQGGVPMYANPFIIPDSCSPVKITLENEYGEIIVPETENNGGLNPCVIDGVEGEITVDDNGTTFFTRLEDGRKKTVAQNTVVYTRAMTNRVSDIIVVFLKELPEGYPPEKYVEILKKMRDYQKLPGGEKSFYVIGPYTGLNKVSAEGIETALSEAFGEYFINAREYLCGEAIEKYGINIRREEYYDDIKRGKVCGAFLTRNGTLNIYGNYAIADLIAERLKENDPEILEIQVEHDR